MKEGLDSLLDKKQAAILLPASSTEYEIMVLCTQIADKLNKASPDKNTLSALFQKLHHEVTYLSFD